MRIVLTILTAALLGFAQDAHKPHKNNALFVDIFGNGHNLSVNYGRLLTQTKAMNLGVIAGFGIASAPFWLDGEGMEAFTFPHSFTVNLGERSVTLELGLGGTLIFGYTTMPNLTSYALIPQAGMRFTSEKGFLFRVYFGPHFYVAGESLWYFDSNIIPYGGISVGGVF